METQISTWKLSDYQAAAHYLGYDPNKIKLHYTFTEEMAKMMPFDVQGNCPSMAADMDTGTILVFPKEVPAGEEMGSMAHEIFHFAYFGVIDHIKNRVKKGDFSLVTKFLDALGSPVLLQECEFVSKYAELYKKLYLRGDIKEFIWITETLSEMARVKEQTGKLINSPVWRNLYLNIESTAVEIGVIRR